MSEALSDADMQRALEVLDKHERDWAQVHAMVRDLRGFASVRTAISETEARLAAIRKEEAEVAGARSDADAAIVSAKREAEIAINKGQGKVREAAAQADKVREQAEADKARILAEAEHEAAEIKAAAEKVARVLVDDADAASKAGMALRDKIDAERLDLEAGNAALIAQRDGIVVEIGRLRDNLFKT